MNDSHSTQVSFSPSFSRDVKRLRKKYPKIQEDLQPFIEQLLRGETPGDQIQATGHTVCKARLPNRDAQKGKSGGYRVIYYMRDKDKIILLTIYSKSEQSDTTTENIQKLIENTSSDSDDTDAT